MFDQSIPSFIRQKPDYVDDVKVYFSYNPPRNPYEWINDWVTAREEDPEYFIDTSTYLDDELGFTTEQQLKLIESYKQNDYDYYRWLYLGEVIGLGTNIYNMDNFKALKELPNDDYITNWFCAIDSGHEVSATTFGAYGLTRKGNVILLDTYYYSPQGKAHKKPPSELSKDLYSFINKLAKQFKKPATKLTIDSAEGALDNQFYNDYGVHLHKVAKLKKVDMIDRVQNIVAQGRFYYLDTEENKIFIEEHRNYRWDEKTYHITNELYRSYQSDVIGEQVALETLYPNLAPELTFTDVITKPLFAYFRTPGANNKNLDSPLGVGIVDNSRNVIDAINRTHDMFVHEVRMGKRRIAVPAEMLKPTGNLYGDEVDDAHPVLFDKDEDVYQGMYGDTDKLSVTDLTSDIRSTQFKESIDYFLREFEQQIGFSSGTFSYDGQGVKTATEVVSENSATYQTRSSYLTQVELFLNQLVNAILEVASVGQFFSDGKPRWTGNVEDVELSVHFDDGVFIDKDKQRADEMQLVAAGIMPKLEYLKRNFGLSEEDAQKWLAQVNNEQPDFFQGSFQEPIDGDSNEV